MKPQSPLGKMNKARQRRKLDRDIHQYLRSGGSITPLPTATAKGLCPVSTFDLYQKLGLYREL